MYLYFFLLCLFTWEMEVHTKIKRTLFASNACTRSLIQPLFSHWDEAHFFSFSVLGSAFSPITAVSKIMEFNERDAMRRRENPSKEQQVKK